MKKGKILIGLLSIVCAAWVVGAGYMFLFAVGMNSDGLQYQHGPYAEFFYNAVRILMGIIGYGSLTACILFAVGGFLLLWNYKWRGIAISGLYITYATCVFYVSVVFVDLFHQIWTNKFEWQYLGIGLIALLPVIFYAFLPIILHFFLSQIKNHQV